MARYVQGPEGVQVIQDDPRYMLPPGVQQINTNQNVPGGAFQNLLNQLKNRANIYQPGGFISGKMRHDVQTRRKNVHATFLQYL